jgi:hypothetical protein
MRIRKKVICFAFNIKEDKNKSESVHEEVKDPKDSKNVKGDKHAIHSINWHKHSVSSEKSDSISMTILFVLSLLFIGFILSMICFAKFLMYSFNL